MAAEGRQGAADGVRGHRHDFDRQREGTQRLDQLGAVGDAHELARHGRDDLLARQRRAAALDHGAGRVDLVGAVDVDGNRRDVVQVEHLDAVAAQARRRRFGRCNGALDARLDLAEFVDEEVRGGAGADADDFAVDHVIDGGAGHRLLEFVLSHDGVGVKRIRHFNGFASLSRRRRALPPRSRDSRRADSLYCCKQ